jgi:hypothetical protein
MFPAGPAGTPGAPGAPGKQGVQGIPGPSLTLTVNGKTGPNITLAAADVGAIATTAVGAANGVATLDGTGHVPLAELPATIVGALQFQGLWNASTNTPTLVSSVGTMGFFFTVSVAGSTDINGISTWDVGDQIIFNGTVWERISGGEGPVTIAEGGTGATTAAQALTNLGAGGLATANTWALGQTFSSGATISGGSINGAPVGNAAPSTGNFTALGASGPASIGNLNVPGFLSFTDNDGSGALPTASAGGGAWSWNFDAGIAEVDNWNTFTASVPSASFAWYQLNATGAPTQLATLGNSGLVVKVGGINSTPIGSTTPSTGNFTTVNSAAATGYQLGGVTVVQGDGNGFNSFNDPTGGATSALFLGDSSVPDAFLRSPTISLQNTSGAVTYGTFNSSGLAIPPLSTAGIVTNTATGQLGTTTAIPVSNFNHGTSASSYRPKLVTVGIGKAAYRGGA